jgi:hypothetical protein
MRTLATPEPIKDWSLTSLREKLVKIGAKLARRRLKHGVFHSVVDLQAAINRFIAEHNVVDAKPFV